MHYKLLPLLVLLNCTLGARAQRLMACYEYIPSPIATYREDVYFDGAKTIAIRDSVALNKPETASDQADQEVESAVLSVVLDAGKHYRNIVIQDPQKKGLLETRSLNDKNYLIEDETFKALDWNTDYSEEEKFGDKLCRKATADYRGTKIVAYYDPAIPVPSGPYKFGGLPGLVVLLYNESANPHYWLLKSVHYPFKGEIPIEQNYIQALPSMSLKEYVQQDEQQVAEQMRVMQSKLPEGVEFQSRPKGKKIRGTVEQIYEWEHVSN